MTLEVIVGGNSRRFVQGFTSGAAVVVDSLLVFLVSCWIRADAGARRS